MRHLRSLFVTHRRRDPAGRRTTAVAGRGGTADEPVAVTPLPSMRELIPPIDVIHLNDDGGGRVEPPPDEEGMPRWLRPSLREARRGPPAFRRWDD